MKTISAIFFSLILFTQAYGQARQNRNNSWGYNQGQYQKPKKKKTQENICLKKFKNYRQEYYYSDAKKFNICYSVSHSTHNIGQTSWTNYFKCLDAKEPYVARSSNSFYKNCTYYQHSNWMISSNFQKCLNEVDALGATNAKHYCAHSVRGKNILSKDLKKCFPVAEEFGANINDKIKLCSQPDAGKIVDCYEELSKYTGRYAKTFNSCTEQRVFDGVVRSGFESCMGTMKSLGVSETERLSVCISYNADEVASCITRNHNLFSIQSLSAKCTDYQFRDKSKSSVFPGCVNKARADGLSDISVLDICTQSRDKVELVANSRKFHSCKNLVTTTYSFQMGEAYSACSSDKILSKIDDKRFMACIKSGTSSAIFDYFNLQRYTLNHGHSNNNYSSSSSSTKKNPYYYVFDDCFKTYYKKPYSKKNNYVRLYKDYNIHSDAKFKDQIKLGGLSALRFDSKKGKVYFLSDDKGAHGSPRIYVYNYSFNQDTSLSLTENSIIKLKKKGQTTSSSSSKQKSYKNQNGQTVYYSNSRSNQHYFDMDPEGMDFTASGNIVITSEANKNSPTKFISVFSPTGTYLNNMKIAKDFLGTGKNWNDSGVQNNKSVESLTISPSKNKMYLANEASLKQDFPLNEVEVDCDDYSKGSSSVKKYYGKNGKRTCIMRIGDVVRIVRYVKSGTTYKEAEQFFYRLEKERDNGLVELLAINDNMLLTLERSWDSKKSRLTSRIYAVNLANAEKIVAPVKVVKTQPAPVKVTNSTEEEEDDFGDHRGDHSNDNSSNQSHYDDDEDDEDLLPTAKPVEKTLILDLDDIKPALSPGFRRLDNFEGMAFGPKLPNGKNSLVLVTDNNFRDSQRTLLILLEIDVQAIKNKLGK
jgi:hypothetical protein